MSVKLFSQLCLTNKCYQLRVVEIPIYHSQNLTCCCDLYHCGPCESCRNYYFSAPRYYCHYSWSNQTGYVAV